MKIAAKITRLVDKPDSAVKAFASVSLDSCFAVHGLRVMDSKKGLFVNMPSNSYKDKDGRTQYSDIFHAVTKGAREALSNAVLAAYKLAIAQTQQAEVEITPGEDDEPAEDFDSEPEYSM